MLLNETLAVLSVERFLAPAEVRRVIELVERHKRTLPEALLSATGRAKSVHSVAGLGLVETMATYEPAGRVEIEPVPAAVHALLGAAVERALPALGRVLPSVARGGEWIYLEYERDQFITPHVDYAIDSPPSGPSDHAAADLGQPGAHVAGIGIALGDGYEGGEFYVETTAAPELWRDDHPHLVADGADHTSDWFPSTERTRWTARPAAGTALVYGSQLVHGTLPVTSGVVRKIVGFLLEEQS